MKKAGIFVTILILVCIAVFFGILSWGTGGGEIGFEATVTQIGNGEVYATVTKDSAGLFSRKLPNTIVICTEFFPEYEFKSGDLIQGCYIRKECNGDFYRVVSIVVNGK